MANNKGCFVCGYDNDSNGNCTNPKCSRYIAGTTTAQTATPAQS